MIRVLWVHLTKNMPVLTGVTSLTNQWRFNTE